MLDAASDVLSHETSEAVLNSRLREFERHYFAGQKPIEGLEVTQLPGPSQSLVDRRVIQIHPNVATYPKICGILILHELIHSKLLQENGDPDVKESERFQAEVERLYEAKAYRHLF
jgi:hypothetical protein